jgi:hypothetical protein
MLQNLKSESRLSETKTVKLSRYHHAGDTEERKYSSYSFLTSALDGMNGQRHAPATLYPRVKDPGTHWIGGWVGLSWSGHTGLRKNLYVPGIEPRSSSL